MRKPRRSLSARDWILQLAYTALVCLILYYMLFYAPPDSRQTNAESFDVLTDSAGWSIPMSFIPLDGGSPYWLMVVSGLLNTVVLGVISLSLASLVGLVVGIARTARNGLARLLGTTYVEVFRNIPEILVVLFVYQIILHLPTIREAFAGAHGVALSNRGFFMPGLNVSYVTAAAALLIFICAVVGIGWLCVARRAECWPAAVRRLVGVAIVLGAIAAIGITLWMGHSPGKPLVSFPELHGFRVEGGLIVPASMLAMIVGIALFGGAYIGEIARAGFQAVPGGQTEAARTLGLSTWHILVRVRLPLGFRAMLPTLTSQYVWLLKATTLGIAVGYADLFMVILQSITQAGHTIAFIGILVFGFLFVNLSLASTLNFLNRRLALKDRG